MELDLVYLPSAEADLASIYDWLAGVSSPDRAFGYVGRIQAACRSLTDFPHRGSPRDELEPGLRSIPFERRAAIYYRVAGETVEIVRILHAGRDSHREFRAS